MNIVKRWKFGITQCDCVHRKCGLTVEQTEENCGWVMLSDYQHLEAERNILKAEIERLKVSHANALADFWAIHKGYFDLKSEVERLRSSSFTTAVPSVKYEEMLKAGDAMADFLGPCGAVRKWNKAKDSR